MQEQREKRGSAIDRRGGDQKLNSFISFFPSWGFRIQVDGATGHLLSLKMNNEHVHLNNQQAAGLCFCVCVCICETDIYPVIRSPIETLYDSTCCAVLRSN